MKRYLMVSSMVLAIFCTVPETRNLYGAATNCDSMRDASITFPEAVLAGDLDAVKSLFSAGSLVGQTPPRVISAVGENGCSLLGLAAEQGHFSVVQYLIEQGADATIADRWGRTPLHEAARGGFLDMVCFLVECGAEPWAQDIDGWTPVDRALWNDHFPVAIYLSALVESGEHEQPVSLCEVSAELVSQLAGLLDASNQIRCRRKDFANGLVDAKVIAKLRARVEDGGVLVVVANRKAELLVPQPAQGRLRRRICRKLANADRIHTYRFTRDMLEWTFQVAKLCGDASLIKCVYIVKIAIVVQTCRELCWYANGNYCDRPSCCIVCRGEFFDENENGGEGPSCCVVCCGENLQSFNDHFDAICASCC